MAATFSRTLRLLEHDGRTRKGLLAAIAALMLAWLAWFALARVPVYESTSKARIEVAAAAHPVAARVAGQLVTIRVKLGERVEAGDVLAELDADADRLILAEKQAHSDGAKSRLSALRKEIAAEEETARAQIDSRQTALDEARAQIREADAKSAFAEKQVEVCTKLRKTSAVTELEYRKAVAEAEECRAAVRKLSLGVTRLEKDRAVLESERRSRVAKVEREAVEVEAEIRTSEAAIRRLQHDIDLRTVRAPIAGRVGEAADFRVGSVVRVGEKLGAVVPEGPPRAVAFFPAAIVGKVRPGQPARLRLDGFAWTQFGTLPATVVDIGNESMNGMVRVELSIPPEVRTPIPLEHGQPGTAEIEVERVSPAVLVLRAAGQFLVDMPPHPDAEHAKR
jgi:membrane fusion protein (multidrug efflux system)